MAEQTCSAIVDAGIPGLSDELCIPTIAKIMAAEGRISEQRELVDSAVASKIAAGDSSRAMRLSLIAILDRFWISGDHNSATRELDELQEAIDIDQFVDETAPWTMLSSLLIALNRPEEAAAALNRAGSPVDQNDKFLFHPMARAVNEAYQNGPDASLIALEDLYNRGPSFCKKCGLDYLGQAYEEAGRTEDAMATYEEFVTAIQANIVFRMPKDTAVLFRLGALHEDAGRSDEAIKYYSLYAERMKNADDFLQPLVQEANRRIDTLLERQTREPAN